MGVPQDIGKGLDLFRTLIFDNAIDAVLTTELAGIVGIPIIGGWIKSLILKFADAIYNKLKDQVVFGSILFVDVAHRKVFETASIGLKKVAIEKGLNSPEYREAHAKEKEALKKFGQFNIVQPGLSG
jgi:hypothetical protein